MSYTTSVLVWGLIVGMIGVASNPSPFFAAWGLVMMSGVACTMLAVHGGMMVSLVLFLIYLGGMLVAFAYCVALAAEPYPETWGSARVAMTGLVYLIGTYIVGGWMWKRHEGSNWWSVEGEESTDVCRGENLGVASLYSSGGYILFFGAFALFLTLFVVLELVRGLSRGALRSV